MKSAVGNPAGSWAPNIWNFDVDQEYWVGISIKLDNDFDDGRTFNDQGMVMQWHYYDWLYDDGLQPQPLVVRFTGNNIRVHSENAGDELNWPPLKRVWQERFENYETLVPDDT